jgi:hypothetical protein
MVGAGFSMNADAIFVNAKRFPSWQDLGNVFYQKVRGEEIQSAEYNFFDPLKLAYEVEANFGRSVLDSMLRSNIPDSDYKPSILHNSLLSLPWTDVFTTNYDTLLERAADTVSERNYKVVVNKDDLVHSVSPRIVKLHGCFSASTPLIISEEDYRTYPKKYAPFVNTVQQTLLENTLCLIGFSGDDPNFLKWIGWIRDNLGAKNAPRIYLVGVLNLSTSQEKSLAHYNITCVDMSLCSWIGEKDHQAGIKAFIDYCLSKKENENQNDWSLSSTLSHSTIQNLNEASSDDINNELTKLIDVWGGERKSYPNWLITPHEKREVLWAYTKSWSAIFDKKITVNIPGLINFIYEFLWRKEKSLLPIFDNEVELIKKSIRYDANKLGVIGKDKDKTLFIILALLRYYREEGDKESWVLLFDNVTEAFRTQFESDSLTFEKALYLLFENNRAELVPLLSGWNASASSVYWMYRKASVLAEIGNLIDAKGILEKALIKTRKKINSTSTLSDYSNVSLESYILVLLTNVNSSIHLRAGNWSIEKNPYAERLNELRQYQCSPLQEIQLLELNIKHEPVKIEIYKTINGFDIGSRQTIHHFLGDNIEALNAFRFLRFFEDAGLSFKLPRLNIGVEGAINAIKRVALYAPYWTLSTMLRTGDQKSIEFIFTRESLSRFEPEFVDTLALQYIELLRNYVNNEKCLYEYGHILPEALSRLCCRCTLKTKDEILELISTIYRNNPSRLRFSGVDTLVKRLLYSFSDIQLYQRLKEITSIAYCVVNSVKNKIDMHSFPNPFKFFLDLKKPDELETYLKLSTETIRQLLDSTESDVQFERENSSLTLIRVHQLGLLNKNQFKSLLSRLLSSKDKYGLPKNTGFYRFSYVELFEERKEIVEGLKLYLLDVKPLIQADLSEPNSYGMGSQSDIYARELVGSGKSIIWQEEELHLHAKNLLHWWAKDKELFVKNKKNNDILNEMKNRFSMFVNCIDLIIIQNNLSDYRNDIKQLVEEFKSLGLKHLYLKAASLSYLKEGKEDFILELEEALSSFNKESTLDALWAIDFLIDNNSNLEPSLLQVFSTFIRYASNQRVISAFNIVLRILKRNPSVFTRSIEKAVMLALDKIINGYDELSFDENLELKEVAAGLASHLNHYYKTQCIDVPKIITQWEEGCLSENEFSEIRNQWKNKE